MKFFFAFGTRPETIKMAPLIKTAQERGHEVFVALSGQHKEMVTPFLDFFEITADSNLQVMMPNQSLEEITSKCLLGYSSLLKDVRPDYTFVQGDTTTAFTGALSSFYQQVPVAHIEAGLRTGDIYSPFPEEVNRKLIAQMAHSHYCPTENNLATLQRENITKNVFVTGNTSIDALDYTLKKIQTLDINNVLTNEKLAAIDFSNKRTILVTAHRRENHGDGLRSIFEAILEILATDDDLQVVFPVHLNPNVQNLANELLGKNPQVHLVEPLGYVDFVWAMSNAYMILSDSGGVQEEAPHLGKPVLVLRETTERQEAIDAKCSILVGTKKSAIVKEALKLLQDQTYYDVIASTKNPYGDATAAEKTIKAIESL